MDLTRLLSPLREPIAPQLTARTSPRLVSRAHATTSGCTDSPRVVGAADRPRGRFQMSLRHNRGSCTRKVNLDKENLTRLFGCWQAAVRVMWGAPMRSALGESRTTG